MHPEMSLVLLTVLAGAGQGIFIVLVALNILFQGAEALPLGYVLACGIVSLVMQVVGIIASTSHLGNPQRGWRAMLMVKNSWLSREVITLSLSVGAVAAYTALSYYGIDGAPLFAAGLLGIIANIGFYISSSMVYGSVKFIKEWANAYTPINFFIFGITSGAALNLAILYNTNADPSIIHGVTRLVIVLTILSLIMKTLSYKYNASAYVSVNVRNAIGVNNPDIKLMDMGVSYAHYNTKEYFHPYSKKNNSGTQLLVLNTAFVLPLILCILMAMDIMGSFSYMLSIVASISMMVGLIMERRLFFIQGNNIQNLFYSNFRSTAARNPLVSKARKGTPLSN